MSGPTAATDASAGPPPPGPRRLWLMIVRDGALESVALPERGDVAIGRGGDAAVRIDDASVSRIHARLHIDDVITIEDLGGTNGTHVAGAQIAPGAPVRLRFGEVFYVGRIALSLQQELPAPALAPASRGAQRAAGEQPLVITGAMRDLLVVIERVAGSDLAVLVLGETGVGKEVCAELVHTSSPRRAGPFVRINCAALGPTLLESELFGHERGAFTGASAAKPGLLETAHGGTVFLDEVGELPLDVQVKLLRVLEERTVRPVGGVRARAVDVRFVAATNRDLEAEAARGAFRQDLYFRLAGVTLRVPSLRQRPADLEPLAETFLAAAAARAGRAAAQLSPAARARLTTYPWPGNVRELRSVIERAVLLSDDGGMIEPAHMMLGEPEAAAPDAPAAPTAPDAPAGEPKRGASRAWWLPDAAAHERARIIEALEQAGGNQTAAATLLGMSRRTLLYRLDELGIPRPRKR